MNKRYLSFLFTVVLFFPPYATYACELCAVFNSLESTTCRTGDVRAGMAYQYQFSDSPFRPEGYGGLERQEVQSYTTQIIGQYGLLDRITLQLNVPIIYREFRRVLDGKNVSGHESGIGDLSFLVKYQPVRFYTEDLSLLLELFSGVKLPTGDTDRLSEVDGVGDSRHLRHGIEAGSVVGGDDLTLGSGSVDFLLGGGTLAEWRRFMLLMNLQYSQRNEGDFDYEFGDDLQWQVAFGRYLSLSDSSSTALRVRWSGERKLSDKKSGRTLSDSSETNLFLGPELVFTSEKNLFLSLGADFAVVNDDASEEIVSKRRLNFNMSYRF